MLSPKFELKDGVDLGDLMLIHPNLMQLFSAFLLYCGEFKLPCVVTSVVEHLDVRVSMTHDDGRAIDISVKGWDDFHIHRIQYHLNKKFADIAAISYSDGLPRAIVYHDVGLGKHFHLQVKP